MALLEMIALVTITVAKNHSSNIFHIGPIIDFTMTNRMMQGDALAWITWVVVFSKRTVADRTGLRANDKLHDPVKLLDLGGEATLALLHRCLCLHAPRIPCQNKYLKE